MTQSLTSLNCLNVFPDNKHFPLGCSLCMSRQTSRFNTASPNPITNLGKQADILNAGPAPGPVQIEILLMQGPPGASPDPPQPTVHCQVALLTQIPASSRWPLGRFGCGRGQPRPGWGWSLTNQTRSEGRGWTRAPVTPGTGSGTGARWAGGGNAWGWRPGWRSSCVVTEGWGNPPGPRCCCPRPGGAGSGRTGWPGRGPGASGRRPGASGQRPGTEQAAAAAAAADMNTTL